MIGEGGGEEARRGREFGGWEVGGGRQGGEWREGAGEEGGSGAVGLCYVGKCWLLAAGTRAARASPRAHT